MKKHAFAIFLVGVYVGLGCKCSLYAHTTSQPVQNRCVRLIVDSAQLCQAGSHPKSSQNPATPSIGSLLFSGSPHAIGRLVVSIVVNSFERRLGWTFTHIIQKVRKVSPLLANLNSTRSVKCEPVAIRISCPLNHAQPASVCSGVGFPMSWITKPLKASTRFNGTPSKELIHDGQGLAAFAFADTLMIVIDRLSRTQNGESCKNGTGGDRLGIGHGIGSFNVVFSGGRPASTGARCDYLHLLPFTRQS